jgi:hypothetical protein
MEEEWRKIEGFPSYTVSNLGRVRSIKREQAVILKVFKNNYGYLQVCLYNENNKKCGRYIHRLVASAFISNYENKPEVNHIDGNKANNSVNNLEWNTDSENKKHAYTTGLCSRAGVHNNLTRLTEDQVIEIYMLAHAGSLTQNEIGQLFGITYSAVSCIKSGKNWKEITAGINIQSQKQEQTTIC